MAKRYTDEFRRDAVRMAATSGLTRPQFSSDLGAEFSTLKKWVQQHQHEDLMSGPHGKQDAKQRELYSSISTSFIIQGAGTRRWVSKAPWPSNERLHK